ncbi:MAG TPA: ABC transporter substrate-binding protein [Stellaceae bacterium]|nr:ABC transporter substrate-binding protein [Stellaceae bacterium]
MSQRLTRRDFAKTAAGAALAAAALPAAARAAASDTKTLRFIAQADLRVLDPIWTTAYITRNHGYCVFDTLFAIDAEFAPHPQMVDDFSVSPDKLTYRFKLRDGLGFHDGSPVRGADCVASTKRWMARDGHGQAIAAVLDQIAPDGDKAFTIKLKEPFALLIDGLAKVSSLALFIMPERLANTDPFKQVTEMVGSGPFKFVKEEFQPGNKAVYVKNTDYVPRKEPPSWASGGKVVKVDRVEWLNIPDAATKVAALNAGEADWWENPPLDLLPAMTSNPDITIAGADPLPSPIMVRFNHLLPPFNNVKMRQAVLMVVSQPDFLTALAGDKQNWQVCPSFFTCGTPMSSDAGGTALTGKRDFDKAKQLISEAGYKGERIVVMDGVDQPVAHSQALVIADVLKKLGLNVELQAMDWGTLVTRRALKDPLDKGGWNIFATGWVGADMLDPVQNLPLKMNGDKAWFGWPSDDKLEALRAQWLKAVSLDDRKKIAAEIQERAFEVVPYLPTGQWAPKTAYRKNVKGVIEAPAFLMWNVEKT